VGGSVCVCVDTVAGRIMDDAQHGLPLHKGLRTVCSITAKPSHFAEVMPCSPVIAHPVRSKSHCCHGSVAYLQAIIRIIIPPQDTAHSPDPCLTNAMLCVLRLPSPLHSQNMSSCAPSVLQVHTNRFHHNLVTSGH
jgi:hypothetical protein